MQKNIILRGSDFLDTQGRQMLLRGVNLGGSSKMPMRPYTTSHDRETLFEKNITFAGRPFPLEEADEHFGRLKSWGLVFIRFLVSWEAIAHTGPGQYDEEYLDYVLQLATRAQHHGLNMFIDPHQDVWSRFTGGDGAPRWTLDLIGFKPENFASSGAAYIHCMEEGPLPAMIWPTNYSKLATATMFSLFFAGNILAPNCMIAGEPVQDFLQRHYFAAIQRLAAKLAHLPNIIGYDTMNEPSPGWIGWQNLHKTEYLYRKGATPTPFQAMAAGAGYTQEVANWALKIWGPWKTGKVMINPQHVSAWKEGYDCIWKQQGVWAVEDSGKPILLKPAHFSSFKGKSIDFGIDHFQPFVKKFAAAIRKADPPAIIFVEFEVGKKLPVWEPEDAVQMVNAAHWYDVMTLFLKRFFPWLAIDVLHEKVVIGRGNVARMFRKQFEIIKEEGIEKLRGAPTLIGEFGIPMDMNGKSAYKSDDFTAQERALDRTFQAMEANLLHGTLWVYTADNTNRHGDMWNGEDLSIFSKDQQKGDAGDNTGGRALAAVVRPYPLKVAGHLTRFSFDYKKQQFIMEFTCEGETLGETEIFVPSFHYSKGIEVIVSDGNFMINLAENSVIYTPSDKVKTHRIEIRKGD